MKIQTKIALTLLTSTLAAGVMIAQDAPERPQRPGGPGGPGGPGFRMVHPVVGALDANKDGTIDAQEIANAANALKTLDKNSDGSLTPDELMPQRPGRGAGGPGGPGGPGGEGRERRPAPPQ